MGQAKSSDKAPTRSTPAVAAPPAAASAQPKAAAAPPKPRASVPAAFNPPARAGDQRRATVAAQPQPYDQASQNPYKNHPIYRKWESLPEPEINVTKKTWEELEGPKLEPLLDDLDLVDLAFVVEITEAGLPLPRQQWVPKGARINKGNLKRIKMPLNSYALALMVLSYPWLDPEHPDRQLATCKHLLKCFKAFLQGAAANGEGCTVGLMMDYPCLPQKRLDGYDDRSPEEKLRFKRALSTINEWYMHPYSSVIIFDTPMPGADSGHRNLRPYTQRGWCTFEYRASCLVKGMFCLWSLAGYEKAGASGTWASGVQGGKSAIQRAAPMIPEDFGAMLRDGVGKGQIAFTAQADLELVIRQYEFAFKKAFSETKHLMYQALKWDEEHLIQMAQALAYAKEKELLGGTQTLRIWGNEFETGGPAHMAVKDAISGLKITLFDT